MKYYYLTTSTHPGIESMWIREYNKKIDISCGPWLPVKWTEIDIETLNFILCIFNCDKKNNYEGLFDYWDLNYRE